MSEDNILTTLQNVFKYENFKSDLQEKAVRAVYKRNNDVLISMPTGSGKSLCYQLPSVMFQNKVSIVFSPLLALIKDQIDHLIKINIRAVSLNSKTPKKERESIICNLKTNSNIKLLYITPEQATTSTFKTLYEYLIKNDKVSYLIVDEAHCVSQWGHDFRPDYLKLSLLRENNSVPLIAVTATAGFEVMKDIITHLKLSDNYLKFKTSCFRKNLFYDVIFKNLLDNSFEHLRDFIRNCLNDEENIPKDKKSCGIIYCRTREQTEELANKLNILGISSFAYHSGLNNKDRLSRQENWQNGQFPVICATISFGMGVDKATVRFVVHWGISKDPASYYQESGRAGRDGKQSFCRLYYDKSDQKAYQFILTQELGKVQPTNDAKRKKAEHALECFNKIVEYCETARFCRHRLFSDYFGDSPPACDKNCDICKDKKYVETQIENLLMYSIQYNSKPTTQGDFSDLYEGGRKGGQSEFENYQSDEGSSWEREQRAKKASADLIQKQFSLRKSSLFDISEEEKKLCVNARVKVPECTSKKVQGLSVLVREKNIDILASELEKNNIICKSDNFEKNFTKNDFEDCAVELEYEIFTQKTNLIMYRASVAKLVAKIKKNTENMTYFDSLTKFVPKKHNNLVNLFKNIKKEELFSVKKRPADRLQNFQTAKDLLDAQKSKKIKLDANQSQISTFFSKNSNSSDSVTENKSNLEFSDVELPQKTSKKDLFGESSSDSESEKRNFIFTKISEKTSNYLKQKETIELDPKTAEKPEQKPAKKTDNLGGNKQKIGQLVVQLLMPAYAQKKFESKDVFKTVARRLSHVILNKGYTEESKIKKYIEDFLKKNPELKEKMQLKV